MKLQLAVGSKILMDLFLDDSVDSQKRERKRRLHYHQLLVNEQLVKYWEMCAKEEGLEGVFQNWFVQVYASAEKMILSEESGKTEELDILINLVSTNINQVVVSDTDGQIRNQHPKIRFCDVGTFGEKNVNPINMDNLLEINRSGGAISKSFFSIFETPLELDVQQGKSAKLLAKYLSLFYDQEEMIVQDRYFVGNEKNFIEYILPYIDEEKCKLTIIFQKSDGAKHKQRIEKKYKASVKCYDDQSMHESFISTKMYKIRLGYRLDQFGENGRTKRDSIHIRRIQT